MSTSALEILRTRPDLAELAAFPFNFDLDRAYHVEDVHLASGAPLEAIAGDDTGGTYFLCGGAAVLHASSDGAASLVAGSVEEALEILIRLPWWCEDVSAGMTEEELHAAVREGDEEARAEFAPDLDDQRDALLRGLGLPDRPLTELVALDEAATADTEPYHLLLNSAELCAYQLEERYRQPLRDIVLGPGRAALEWTRSGVPDDARDAWEEIAEDFVLCEGVLRAASEDRRPGDLPLLRFLLERACAAPVRWPEGPRTAAVPVAAYGEEADVPLLREATAGQVTESARAVEWARAEAAEQDEFTWVELARRQGRTEHARVALIRMLDDTGPRADRLRRLSRALERLGDHAQAARAQFNLVSLQDTGRDRAAEVCVLARLERLKGDLPAASRALERARAAVGAGGGEPDETVSEWRGEDIGRLIIGQHLELTLAAVEAGDAGLARTTMAYTEPLLDTFGEQGDEEFAGLFARVEGLSRPGGVSLRVR